MTKYTKYESGLWRTGVVSLINVVQNGIRSLSDATVLRNDADRVILIWNSLIETVENFLFFDHSGLPTLLPEQVFIFYFILLFLFDFFIFIFFFFFGIFWKNHFIQLKNLIFFFLGPRRRRIR